ncbi:MAG: ABC transporter substrate-binding protein, partial [Candidatus Omnitrophica bacterium]|nr:ABC transporter substrate-binding protein [Candidatus Omnitrophota bacterium]
MKKEISFGYTPDPDDAFHLFGLETGRIHFNPSYRITFEHEHIQALNQRVLSGDIDVSAVSSVLYPQVADRYIVLPCGTSVGRGYGPVLGALTGGLKDDLQGRRVGVPGKDTTGYFLLKYFYRNYEAVEMEYNEIIGAILDHTVDAGVLIHEELLNYQFRGIEKVCCLGERWWNETKLPLPVGLTVIKKDLGPELIREISEAL